MQSASRLHVATRSEIITICIVTSSPHVRPLSASLQNRTICSAEGYPSPIFAYEVPRRYSSAVTARASPTQRTVVVLFPVMRALAWASGETFALDLLQPILRSSMLQPPAMLDRRWETRSNAKKVWYRRHRWVKVAKAWALPGRNTRRNRSLRRQYPCLAWRTAETYYPWPP